MEKESWSKPSSKGQEGNCCSSSVPIKVGTSESSHLDEMAQEENKKTNSVAFPEKLAHLKELAVKSRIRGVSQKDLWVWLLA